MKNITLIVLVLACCSCGRKALKVDEDYRGYWTMAETIHGDAPTLTIDSKSKARLDQGLSGGENCDGTVWVRGDEMRIGVKCVFGIDQAPTASSGNLIFAFNGDTIAYDATMILDGDQFYRRVE